MTRKFIGIVCILVVCMMIASVSCAVEKQTGKSSAKAFVQKLVGYPANVTQDSVKTVAETGKKGTAVVTKEVKRVGEVATGDVAKTKELVTEPLTGTAQTTVDAAKETVAIPVEAAKEEPAASTETTK